MEIFNYLDHIDVLPEINIFTVYMILWTLQIFGSGQEDLQHLHFRHSRLTVFTLQGVNLLIENMK